MMIDLLGRVARPGALSVLPNPAAVLGTTAGYTIRIFSVASIPAAGVNAEFLAAAIEEYANDPELRAAIGSSVAV
ncbi:hypothetical protein FB565_007566 [Actinoplanes lutulentus]|uniref:Uncharacterized protein n=1 Tax=Actinoplanes lutulentus TaxID=1287878 RepID=A0A327Z3Y9_9ACTN|nr:hypothetical protein [Actinoplanes lutulentus]MBB2947795.1 hypothetical protein [Actinoplanes lutulentus]RAK29891.1 hypothetical protein B0I29_117217 [Actinoplanes lutulentus]